MGALQGKVAVVTGASRGIGKGIAMALGDAGATVYVTGRTTAAGQAKLPGTIGETAEAVTKRGGRGIAVACDHSDDTQIKRLFERVADEQQGQLDVLVNNVYKIPDPPAWGADSGNTRSPSGTIKSASGCARTTSRPSTARR